MSGYPPAPIDVDGFSGPFDLLVRLIEQRQLDILMISLAAVTEQYLAYLAALRLRDPEHLSAFLVVAAKLLLIKSSLLLPAPPQNDAGEEAPADPTDLTERLRIYQAFRRAGQWLGRRDEEGLRGYPRPPRPVPPRRLLPKEPPLDPGELYSALLRALARPKGDPVPTPVAVAPRLSVPEALSLLRSALDQLGYLRFGELVADHATTDQRVAFFLALLEAIRIGLATARQDAPFGEIEISRPAPADLPNAPA